MTSLATVMFIDTAVALFGAGSKPAKDALIIPIVLVLIIAAFELLNNKVNGLVAIRIKKGVRAWLPPKIMDKRGSLGYRCIESSSDWNLTRRVVTPLFEEKTVEEVIFSCYISFISSASVFLSFISLITLITVNTWWAGLAITATLVPLILVALRSGKRIYDETSQTAEDRRWADYFLEVLTGRETTAERNLFGYAKKLSETYSVSHKKAVDAQFKVTKKQFRMMSMYSIALTVAGGISSALVLIAALSDEISCGLFVALSGAIGAMIQRMRWRITYLVQCM